jgi:hydrogenase expression/formation protein HypE
VKKGKRRAKKKNAALSPGKLPIELLRYLLGKYVEEDARVILGPGVGRDAAVLDFGDRFLVVKTDPITFATEDIGRYAVHVNANDVATTGARPTWILTTVLLPEGQSDEDQAEAIFRQIREACDALDIVVCGGHTEVTLGLDRPLVVGMMLGEVEPNRLVRQDGALPGDRLILTKAVAIEGTAVLAHEHPGLRELMKPEELIRCEKFLKEPGISVVKEALIACRVGGVHAMHDPTEGGVATALHELAEASAVGLRVRKRAIPIYPETQRVCQMLQLDPLGLLASGALLLAVAPEACSQVLLALRVRGISAVDIGEVTSADDGVCLVQDGEVSAVPLFSQDEVARALARIIHQK